MNDTALLIASGVTLGIWSAILYGIISGATQSNEVVKQLKIQNYFLARQALRDGISKEDINGILDGRFPASA